MTFLKKHWFGLLLSFAILLGIVLLTATIIVPPILQTKEEKKFETEGIRTQPIAQSDQITVAGVQYHITKADDYHNDYLEEKLPKGTHLISVSIATDGNYDYDSEEKLSAFIKQDGYYTAPASISSLFSDLERDDCYDWMKENDILSSYSIYNGGNLIFIVNDNVETIDFVYGIYQAYPEVYSAYYSAPLYQNGGYIHE